eukprot:374315_1
MCCLFLTLFIHYLIYDNAGIILHPSRRLLTATDAFYYEEAAEKYYGHENVKQIIGKGSYGVVFKVQTKNRSKSFTAVKIISKQTKTSPQYEITMHQQAFSIDMLYTTWINPIIHNVDKFWMIEQEYINGVDAHVFYQPAVVFSDSSNYARINEIRKHFDPLHQWYYIMWNMGNFLMKLNAKRIVYQDFKPANIMIDIENSQYKCNIMNTGYIDTKLIDFGHSAYLYQLQSRQRNFAGSLSTVSSIQLLAGEGYKSDALEFLIQNEDAFVAIDITGFLITGLEIWFKANGKYEEHYKFFRWKEMDKKNSTDSKYIGTIYYLYRAREQVISVLRQIGNEKITKFYEMWYPKFCEIPFNCYKMYSQGTWNEILQVIQNLL